MSAPEAKRVQALVAAGEIPAQDAKLVETTAGTFTPAQEQLIDTVQAFGAPADMPAPLQKEVQLIYAFTDRPQSQGK